MSSTLWSDLARSYNMYRKCFPNTNFGLAPREYGMAIQGKHKKKKKSGRK